MHTCAIYEYAFLWIRRQLKILVLLVMGWSNNPSPSSGNFRKVAMDSFGFQKKREWLYSKACVIIIIS